MQAMYACSLDGKAGLGGVDGRCVCNASNACR